ncbi:hypothetical protein DRN73_10145, partial [Candidatus Pacearchaeota archaeon]
KESFATFLITDNNITTRQTLRIIVKDVNQIPEIKEINYNKSLRQGEKFYINLKAEDKDNDTLKISIKGIKNNTTIQFKDKEQKEVKIILDDGINKLIKILKINISKGINAKTNFEAIEGENFSYDFGWECRSSNKDVKCNHSTLKYNIPYVPDHNDWNKTFKITLGDKNYSKSFAVHLNIKDKNKKPEIIALWPPKVFKVKKGEIVDFRINATDYEGDNLSIYWMPNFIEKYEDDLSHHRLMDSSGKKKMIVKVCDSECSSFEWIYYVE